MSKKFKKTGRGFNIYGELTDEYGDDLCLVESSKVGRPNIRLYAYQNKHKDAPFASCITFDVDGAKKLIEILQGFVDNAESEDNWRNSEDYIKNFG